MGLFDFFSGKKKEEYQNLFDAYQDYGLSANVYLPNDLKNAPKKKQDKFLEEELERQRKYMAAADKQHLLQYINPDFEVRNPAESNNQQYMGRTLFDESPNPSVMLNPLGAENRYKEHALAKMLEIIPHEGYHTQTGIWDDIDGTTSHKGMKDFVKERVTFALQEDPSVNPSVKRAASLGQWDLAWEELMADYHSKKWNKKPIPAWVDAELEDLASRYNRGRSKDSRLPSTLWDK